MGTNKRGYRFAEVLQYTGASRSQLTYWTDAGLIKASITRSTGTGAHRVFSFDDLVHVTIAVRLANYRMTLKGVGAVLRTLPRAFVAFDPEVVWLPESFTTKDLWIGSRRDFAKEAASGKLAAVGILIDIRAIINDLLDATEEESEMATYKLVGYRDR